MKYLLNSLLLASLPAFASAAALDLSGWNVSGVNLIPNANLTNIAESDGSALAARIVNEYRQQGYVTVEARINPDTRVIKVIEGVARPSGPYADYLPAGQPLTVDQLDAAANRMATTARLNGELVAVNIRPADASGVVEVATSTSPAPDARLYGGSVVYSSLGQRYSGADVGTVYGYWNPGNGQQLDASVSHGFSGWRDDSEGGRFENANLGYRKASRYGLTWLQYQFVDYKTGGQIAPLDLHGSVERLQLQQSYPIDRRTSLIGRVAYTRNKQQLGALRWDDRQAYGSAFAGLTHQRQFVSLDVGIEQGLGGSQTYSTVPLLGQFSSRYTAIVANVAGVLPLGKSGWSVSAKAGFQTGSNGTPSNSQFFLGGPDRGQSYNTGYAATPQGYYGSLSINAKTWQGVQGYAGVDGARGKPVIGQDREAKSAFIGARFQIAKGISGDMAFSRTLGRNDDPSAHREKINLVLSAAF